MRRHLLQAGIVLFLVAFGGALFAIWSFAERWVGSEPADVTIGAFKAQAASGLALTEAKRAFDRGGTVCVDARSAQAYRAGHIPGALNIPLPADKASVQRVLGDLPKTTRIIAYCGGVSCQSSLALVKALDGFGYTRTKAFYGGWQAWFWAKYPVTRGDAP